MLVATDAKGDYAFLSLKSNAFDLSDRGVSGRAVPAGAIRPNHVEMSKPGTPASAIVGTSGSIALRASPATTPDPSDEAASAPRRIADRLVVAALVAEEGQRE